MTYNKACANCAAIGNYLNVRENTGANYDDILTAEEACEALKIGNHAM